MKNFQGKVAAITGAGSGIGKALALQLAKLGAKISITDINEKNLQETAQKVKDIGAQVFAVTSDVSKINDVKNFVTGTLQEFGQVDLVFNNAGIALGKKSLTELNYDEWEKIMGINLWGVIYGSKEFLPHLLERPEAAIINISSVFGLAGIPEQTPYCTTKFAVRGFTEALRGELSNTHVEVFCVHPGGINTNIAEFALEEAQTDPTKRKEVENFKKMLIHSPEKAANVILDAIRKSRYKVLIGEEAYVFDWMTRALPQGYTKLLELGMNKFVK